VPRQLPPARQRRHAAGIGELRPGQIDDNLRLAGHHRERSGNTRSIRHIKLPAQQHDSMTIAVTSAQGSMLTMQVILPPSTI
jgi:hypothetical protein